VWFLTGSQDLYGDATLRQVATQARDIVDVLNDDPLTPVAIVWKPVLTDPDAIRRTILDANSDDACVGVITWMHTFSPAKMWIRGLDALDKSLLHLHTQANEALPWSSLDMDFMNLNQSAHGDREFGYIQTRMGLSRVTVCGHVSDTAVRHRIASWIRVATACQHMRHLRLARFGDNMRGVAVTEGDKVEAELRSPSATSRVSSTSTWTATRSWSRCAPAATDTTHCVMVPASRPACASSSPPATSPRSRQTSRTSAACVSCQAWPCSD
jgi:L-arabinose isomerase